MSANAIRVWVVLAGLAFLAGYQNEGYADEPPAACDMYECKDVMAHWRGVNSTSAIQFHNDNSLAPTTKGLLDIYTTQSKYDLDLSYPDVWVREYTYDKCYPFCGKDENGVWQAWQEICIAEDANKLETVYTKNKKTACTPTENGVSGKKVNNPKNKNTDKFSPPGWRNDASGDDPPPPP